MGLIFLGYVNQGGTCKIQKNCVVASLTFIVGTWVLMMVEDITFHHVYHYTAVTVAIIGQARPGHVIPQRKSSYAFCHLRNVSSSI